MGWGGGGYVWSKMLHVPIAFLAGGGGGGGVPKVPPDGGRQGRRMYLGCPLWISCTST